MLDICINKVNPNVALMHLPDTHPN